MKAKADTNRAPASGLPDAVGNRPLRCNPIVLAGVGVMPRVVGMNPAVEDRPLVTDCPRFSYTGPREEVRLLYRMCVWATDWLEVVGDPDNGCYEWIHRDENGKILKFSNKGYGSCSVAMRDGLTAALGE